MKQLSVSNIKKSFGDVHAVEDVSFEVGTGEIFGLLGPNGAGKTTTIRIILDIFKPDSGTVTVFEGPMNEEKKNLIGYMPEERGLYQDITLEQCLVYLASLKNVPEDIALERLNNLFERFNLLEYQKKKVKEMSKGMQQKAQIITTLLHNPELVIMDEPFSALDPLNVQLVKELLCDLRDKGVTIIMSTHQMGMVEELCDRILLIDNGRDVLYGDLNEIRRQHSGHAVYVQSNGDLSKLKGVEKLSYHNGSKKLELTAGIKPQDILQQLIEKKVELEKFEIAVPSLNEIFIQVVEEGNRRS
jgi:ABC-2 type transport system ATP-binding protein